jgi:hypothetical protein
MLATPEVFKRHPPVTFALKAKEGCPRHWHILTRDLHMALKPQCVCDYVAKLCRQPAEILQMQTFATQDREYESLTFGGVQ